VNNHGYQKYQNTWFWYITSVIIKIKIPGVRYIYIYNCGSHKKLKSNNRLENCQVFHETQHFFEIFEITRTGGSFLLFFSNTWYRCFFDSQFFFKYPVPVVLSFWFFFSNTRNQWFFHSDFFIRVPTTSGSFILIYSFECPQPAVITIIKDKPPHWSIPENESKFEPEWAGEGPLCKVRTP
jgi:hypothetical protein